MPLFISFIRLRRSFRDNLNKPILKIVLQQFCSRINCMTLNEPAKTVSNYKIVDNKGLTMFKTQKIKFE